MFTVEAFARDFLQERGLAPSEIDAVIKVARDDHSLCRIHWDARMVDIPAVLLYDLRKVLNAKVICWIEKYHPEHKARAMFAGKS